MLDIAVELLTQWPEGEDLLAVAREAARLTLESQGKTGVSLGIALADDDYVRELNRKYRGKDATTDVLSFPLWEEGDEAQVPLGDVVLSLRVASRQATARGHSLETEIIYLVAHGVLHLLGWCDDSTAGEDRMWEIQEEVAVNYHRRR